MAAPGQVESTARSSVRTLPTLDIAARSILESQALVGTVASVVAGRALDHHWESLFQYAAVRVGGSTAAELLQKLEALTEQSDAPNEELKPSPRARLYASMRELMRIAPQLPLSPDAAAWWQPSDDRLKAALVNLRRELPAELSEILELRFTRRLTPEEIGHVLGCSGADVESALASGLALAERWLGKRPASRDRSLEGALLEAFALAPRALRAPRRVKRRPVLEVGSLVADRYEVEALLGSGAFADVYRARDRDVTDHVVALKILRTASADARSVHAALRELQLIASVFHPSVVQLKDHGWHQGHLWFVMPLYRGETLATRLTRGALSRREAREIFEPLAEALASMHRAGVRHQDVKPENVFLAHLHPGGDARHAEQRVLPVLLDLGVAAKDAELVLAGTPAYFAPEVAARFAGAPDPAPVGPKADVFALALTLRRALDPDSTEEVAGGAVDAFVAYRALHAPAAPARRDLQDLRAHFERWLNLSQDLRPTAEELQRELAALTKPEERAQRRLATMRWLVPTGVAVLALFWAVIYALSREAAVQRVEADQARARADRARERAASISASLNEQEAARRRLEADVARLEQQYQTSRLTREQLASRLAQTEGELAVVVEQRSALEKKARQHAEDERELKREQKQARADLDGKEARVRELQAELERANHGVDAERARRLEAENASAQLREQLRVAHVERQQGEARLRELEQRVDNLRALVKGAPQISTGPAARRAIGSSRPDP